MLLVEHFTDDENWELRPIVLTPNPFQYKPSFALYTTPVDSQHSWRQWCMENNFVIGRYRIVLEIDAERILKIDGVDDLGRLAWRQVEQAAMLRDIDWIGMREDGIGGVWLTEKGEIETRYSSPQRSLYGWDCETVAILDEGIVRGLVTKLSAGQPSPCHGC